MSMSEFDKQWLTGDESLDAHHPPDDFSEEDTAFAQELSTLFSLPDEQVPPFYVQTLLQADDPRFQPPDPAFEYKTRARVFRRLSLHRQLAPRKRRAVRQLMTNAGTRRLLSLAATILIVMCLTVILTAPSFAEGMTLLLKGGHAGVVQMHRYPKIKPDANIIMAIQRANEETPPQISLSAAEQRLHSWNMYWPQYLPATYQLSNMYLYYEPKHQWVDGPFIELDYTLTGATAKGTGLLIIREFKLAANDKVMQVVKDGAAQPIKIDQNGQAQEIYVDGQWVMNSTRNQVYPTWQYGQRSELIYQRNGIVFWIVGDQRDGINEPVLDNIASSLQPIYGGRALHMGLDTDLGLVTLRFGDVNGPFAQDVVQVYPFGELTPYLSLVGEGSTQSQISKYLPGGPHAITSST